MVSTDLQTHMVDQLVSSIEKFGNCDPIAAWHNQRGQLEVVKVKTDDLSEQTNRQCAMMELDPHYCDVIIARWEELTGLKAEKAV